MKHTKLISKGPDVAQTSTDAKYNFKVQLTQRIIEIIYTNESKL